MQEIRVRQQHVRFEIDEHRARQAIAQLIEQEQPVAHIGRHDHHHLRVDLLELVEHVIERELLARRGELRLPALGKFTAIVGADIERQVLFLQGGLHRGFDAARLALALLVDAVANVGDGGRKAQDQGITAELVDALEFLGTHLGPRVADAVAERRRLGEKCDFAIAIAR